MNKIKTVFRFVFPAALLFVLMHFVILNASVPSCSMQSVLNPGDRMFCIRQPLSGTITRGDIIIFKAPLTGDLYVKRVIGLPGETISIKEGSVFVNGSDTPLEEDYLYETWTIANDGLSFFVPKDSYFVLGDNRNNSNDARFWALEAKKEGLDNPESYTFVSKDSIVAEAWVKYYPSFCFIK